MPGPFSFAPSPAAAGPTNERPMDLDALFTLNYGLYIVSSRRGDKLNGQVANAVVQVTSSPARLALAVSKANLTHGLIAESGMASVAVLSEDTPLEYIGRFGFRSGRDTEKFEGVRYEIAPSGCPYPLDHVLACLDMAVEHALDLRSHTLFVCGVLDARLLGRGRPMTYAYYREVLRGKTPPTAPSHAPDAGRPPPGEGTARAQPQRYVCDVCGYVYDPALGDPARGVAPGTRFEDLPDGWTCPVCGAGTDRFSAGKA